MCRCYNECETFSSILAQSLEQTNIIKEIEIETFKSIAKSLLGIYLLEVKVVKEKEPRREFSKDEELELFENKLKKLRERKGNIHRMADEDELEKYLKEERQFISMLSGQRILKNKR
jgi:pyruvate/2-oxoacid:ferredoxin oxidoreductase beta subunit